MLVSAVQWGEYALYVCICPPLLEPPFHPCPSISPLQIITGHWAGLPVLHSSLPPVSILHTVVHTRQSCSPHSPHPLLPMLCHMAILCICISIPACKQPCLYPLSRLWIHSHHKWPDFVPFHGWVILHYIYIYIYVYNIHFITILNNHFGMTFILSPMTF